MSNANVARDVAAAVGEQPQNVVEAWVRRHGYKKQDIPEVRQEYAVFLSLNGDGAHYRDAKSWAHVKQGKTAEPAFWFFQLMLLLAESKWEGSMEPTVREEQNPAAYRQIVEMAALQRMHALSGAQAKALRSSLKHDYHFDARFDYDVGVRVKQLEAEDAPPPPGSEDGPEGSEGNKGGRGRKKKKQRTIASAAQQTVAPAAAAAAPPPRVALNLNGAALEWARHFNPQGTAVDSAWERAYECLAPPPPTGLAVMRPPAADPLAETAPFSGSTELPKIRFVVTPLPRVDPVTGDELFDAQGDMQIAGLLCRFLVHDPNIDVMKFFASVVENALQRPERADSRMAQGGGRGPSGSKAQFHKELFPQYGSLYHSHHPASNSTTYSTYFQAAIAFDPKLLNGTNHDDLYSALLREGNTPKHKMHLSRIMTMERALKDAEAAGADPGLLAEWVEPTEKKAKFPLHSYYYMPSQALSWIGGRFLGLREKKFPHVGSQSDFISHVIAGRPLDPFLDANVHLRAKAVAEADKDVRSSWDQVRVLLEENWLVERRLLIETRLVEYDTSNAFVHEAARADLIRKRIDRERPAHYGRTLQDIHHIMAHFGAQSWRRQVTQKSAETDAWLLSHHPERETDSEGIPVNLPTISERVKACERFNELLGKAQRSCLDAFVSLWPTEGDVDSNPIPDTLRNMQKWFRDRPQDLGGHLTREFMKWDPDLSIFGNSMLRQLKMYACIGLILQPVICLLTEGLFSCYRWSPKQLAFNLLLHGKFDTGKTYTAITMLIKLTCIKGTVLPFIAQTKAADTTLRHFYDVIFASDEVAQHKVSQKEAEKNPDLTNKDKLKMTDRCIAVNVFTYETAPSGEQVRWTRTIHTDHYVAMVEVTNHEVEATGALASRYHRLTVAQPQLEARKLQNDTEMSQLLTTATRDYLNVNQYLSACAYKAIQCYAMVEPYMGLFHDLNNLVMDYLQAHRLISKDVGARGLEIMKPYAIQLVIHNAIHCVFDLPGAPMYRKRFTADTIQLLQPYLYCTTDIVWWCWTSLASGWIEEHNSNVVKTVLRMQHHGFSWPENTTAYQQYEWDVDGVLPWRRRPNPSSKADDLIDLQYWTLTGGIDTICRNIAERSQPKIDALVVRGVLTALRNTFIPVPWGGYVPCPDSEMRAWHRCKERPRLVNSNVVGEGLDADDARTIKEILIVKNKPNGNQVYPPYFCANNSDPKVQRTEADMPRMAKPGEISMAAVEFGEHGEIHIMPWVAHHFMANKIVEALRYATYCKTTRTGKILLGMHLPHDQQNLRVEKITPEYLNTFIRDCDLAAGYNEHGTDFAPETPAEDRVNALVSRRVGLSFDRVGAMGETDALFFTAVPPAPTSMTTAEWQAKSEADTSAMGRSRRVISNLDYHSAREQHIRCGRPLDEPVRDPVWIEQQYKAGCAALGRVEHQDMDYPYECTFELEERKEKWMTDSKVRKFSDILSASNQKQSEINRPRKAALLTKMVEKRGFAELLTSESEHGTAAGADGAVLFPFMRPAEPSPAAAKKAKKKGGQAAPPTAKGKKRSMTDVVREAEAVEENAAAARPKAAKSKKQEEMLQMVTKMNQ
jgi:hypothetical protein